MVSNGSGLAARSDRRMLSTPEYDKKKESYEIPSLAMGWRVYKCRIKKKRSRDRWTKVSFLEKELNFGTMTSAYDEVAAGTWRKLASKRTL